MEKEFNVVGARLPMMDAAQKAKGAALFTDDLILPGMLYGKILRSPLAHAKIVRIDTSKAEKLPGVKGVVTGQEIPRSATLAMMWQPSAPLTRRLPKRRLS
jgi:4-hydroxybenzoyl-CoA reductase subunit alpha